jgi:hypothetical protein
MQITTIGLDLANARVADPADNAKKPQPSGRN